MIHFESVLHQEDREAHCAGSYRAYRIFRVQICEENGLAVEGLEISELKTLRSHLHQTGTTISDHATALVRSRIDLHTSHGEKQMYAIAV